MRPNEPGCSPGCKIFLRTRPETSDGEFTAPMVTVVLRTLRR